MTALTVEINPALIPGSQKDLVKQVAGGGLAVCPGHTNDSQFATRIAIKSCRQPGKRLARIFNLDIGNG